MESKPRLLSVLDVVTVPLFLIATYMVFFYAPQEAVMGDVQRVFYFHVATGWVGMLGFIGAAVAGIIYLVKKDRKWDIVGLAAVEIGIVFIFINIVTGAIWARSDLEHLVDLGPTVDYCHGHAADISGLSDAAAGNRRSGSPGALRGSLCHYRLLKRAVDLLLSQVIPHHPPDRDRRR